MQQKQCIVCLLKYGKPAMPELWGVRLSQKFLETTCPHPKLRELHVHNSLNKSTTHIEQQNILNFGFIQYLAFCTP